MTNSADIHACIQQLNVLYVKLNLIYSFKLKLIAINFQDIVIFHVILFLQKLVKGISHSEHQERILNIIEGVGARGFILLNPQCKLVLEGKTISLQPFLNDISLQWLNAFSIKQSFQIMYMDLASRKCWWRSPHSTKYHQLFLFNQLIFFHCTDEMYLPATSKWVTGTIRRRPVHCYLYSNALVVISTDKKVNTCLKLLKYL